MGRQKFQTQYTGVRYCEHPTRKLRNGGADRYFTIRYRLGGKIREDGLGWASEGWNAQKAHAMRSRLREAQKTGDGPQTVEAMRAGTEAAKKAEELRVETEKCENITLDDFFEHYHLPKIKREKRTWDNDAGRFYKLISPRFGKMPLRALTSRDVQNFVDELAETEASPQTVKHYMFLICRIYNVAADTLVGNIAAFTGTNPTKGVRLPAVRNARERFLTGEEVELLLEGANKLKNRDLHDAIALSLNTGLRLGELRRLTWLDVDFSAGFITVRDEANRKPGGKVPMNQRAEKILTERKENASDKLSLVFPPTYGTVGRQKLSHEFHQLVDEIGLNQGIGVSDRQRRIVFHTLRHTFASWLALAGVDIYRIKTLMRHKTLAMTTRYAHLLPDASREAIERLAPPKR